MKLMDHTEYENAKTELSDLNTRTVHTPWEQYRIRTLMIAIMEYEIDHNVFDNEEHDVFPNLR